MDLTAICNKYKILLVTHLNRECKILKASRGSKAFSGICDSMCVCLCDKTKTAETKITKLGTGIVHHKSSPIS